MTHHNQGIVITGGSVNVGSMAAGRGAQVQMTMTQSEFSIDGIDDPQVAERLEALETALQKHADALVDHASAIDQLSALVDELHRPEPRGSRLSEILGTLRDSVGSVATVLGSIASIEHLLAPLL
jgi:hypothetical protein